MPAERKKKILFIINPHSGIKSKLGFVDLIEQQIREDFIVKTRLTQRPEHATEIALEAVESGVDAVIAVGGDGSVNEVGRALIGTDVALGIIPLGSGNGFARHLNIPLHEKDALQTINQFRTQIIDTATINGTPFLATAGLGFDAQVGWQFANHGTRGFLSYVQITASAFMGYKPKTYQLSIDGKEIETTAFLINFANAGQYGNNAWIAPSASLSDGLLNICILDKFPKYYVPSIIYKLFNKKIEKLKYYRFLQGKEIWVRNPDIYHIDGEPRGTDVDLLIKIVPLSLKVIY
ncbi:diacylglycerol kinase family lipid kinase [Cryomorpha ignava]|uniref:Diacylglycerol kinase family lipid kinase n=1 Tax=Cryomorpha ignava TaxID=101383 RepID=A0A7K3WV69_9FLAO|nr:diacylglycerol kinase family protein [Cryomorpha ignava]NEN25386.1 diacylglycerol kinase family lipid kinase [Cryomorpha ignava]